MLPFFAYNAGMTSRQYTIRSIPPQLDSELRRQARKTGKSLNQVILDTLTKGVGGDPKATFNDLDWFIGGKSLGVSFDDAMDWLDAAPEDIT